MKDETESQNGGENHADYCWFVTITAEFGKYSSFFFFFIDIKSYCVNRMTIVAFLPAF